MASPIEAGKAAGLLTEAKSATLKMGISGGGMVICGFTVNEWVGFLSVVLVAMQIGLLLPKYWTLIRSFFNRRKED